MNNDFNIAMKQMSNNREKKLKKFEIIKMQIEEKAKENEFKRNLKLKKLQEKNKKLNLLNNENKIKKPDDKQNNNNNYNKIPFKQSMFCILII